MEELSRAEKLRLSGIKRYGSEEAWREFLRQASNKSRRNHKGNGYFAQLAKQDPNKLRELSSKGGKVGKSDKVET